MLDVQKLTGATLALGLAFGTTGIAHAAVTPAVVDEVLAPGESITIDKFVDTPEISEKVDFLLLLDLSGSYGDDLANIKALDDECGRIAQW